MNTESAVNLPPGGIPGKSRLCTIAEHRRCFSSRENGGLFRRPEVEVTFALDGAVIVGELYITAHYSTLGLSRSEDMQII